VTYSWIALPGIADSLGLGLLVVLGFVLAAAAILGDLVESSLKRECEVKDSSALLPGHGGLLDRMDSLLWTIPVAYFFIATIA
jgi:phosphatidate cytidylyltransferase